MVGALTVCALGIDEYPQSRASASTVDSVLFGVSSDEHRPEFRLRLQGLAVWYFIARFALYLVLAGAVGVVIGWLIWGGEPFEAASPVIGTEDGDQVQELGSQIESKDQEIARLRKRLKRVHSDLDARDSHVLAAKATHDELQGMLGSREDELVAVRRDYDALMAQAQSEGGGVITDPHMERRLSEMEEMLGHTRSEADDLTHQLNIARAQVASAPTTEIESRLATKDAELTGLRRDLESAHAELDHAAHTIVGHEQSIAELSTTVAPPALEATPDMSRLQVELDRARKSLSTWRSRLDEVEEENDRLAGDLAAAQTELSSHGTQGAGLADENERLVAEATRLRNGVIGLDERATKAEAEAAQLQAELVSANAAKESQLSALHVELSDARLRADAAHEALQELTQEFVGFREISQRQQSTVQSLSDRLERARSTLGGRQLAPSQTSKPDTQATTDDLSALPGITPTLLAHLAEFGVSSYAEIGRWGSSDMERYEAMLEVPGVITTNEWPTVARAMWEARHDAVWSQPADSERS